MAKDPKAGVSTKLIKAGTYDVLLDGKTVGRVKRDEDGRWHGYLPGDIGRGGEVGAGFDYLAQAADATAYAWLQQH